MEEVDLTLKQLNLDHVAEKEKKQVFVVVESMCYMPRAPVGVFDSAEKMFEGMKALAVKAEKETFEDAGDADQYAWVYSPSKKNALLRVKKSILKEKKHSFAQLQDDESLHDFKLEAWSTLYLNNV